VGHPLVQAIQSYPYDAHWTEKCGITKPKRFISLFPGSRKGEIKRLFKRQIGAAAKLRQLDPELGIFVSCADDGLKQLIQSEPELPHPIELIPRQFTYEMMRDCHLALTKSGTITLELALHAKPSVVIYDVSLLNRLIARYALRLNLPHYCIVNILCNRTLFPEFIENRFTSDDLVPTLEALTRNGPERQACIEGCAQVHQSLTTSLPSATYAAQSILELL
jgi:lipid-A-disaccharide synthase